MVGIHLMGFSRLCNDWCLWLWLWLGGNVGVVDGSGGSGGGFGFFVGGGYRFNGLRKKKREGCIYVCVHTHMRQRKKGDQCVCVYMCVYTHI